MDLYRIMLVDDEAEVRQSIALKINWEEAGFELVGEAENGQDALEKMETYAPDVVLTDISMPYMDGLEFAKQLNRFYPSVKVVLFSGHDEFEYAQQAIKLNVMEYILKPINSEELMQILKKLYKTLQDEICKRRNVQMLRESFEKNLPILRGKFLDDLVHGRVKEGTALAKMGEYHIDLASAQEWAVFRVAIDIPKNDSQPITLHSETELIPISVKQLLDEKLARYCKCASFQFAGGVCGIAALDKQNNLQGLITCLNDICKEAKRQLWLDITIGVGRKCTSVNAIPTAYIESKSALGYIGILGRGEVIYINDVEPVKKITDTFTELDEAMLSNAIKLDDEPELLKAIEQISAHIENDELHACQCQIYVMQVFCCLQRLCAKYELSDDVVFGEMPDYFEMLSKINSKQEFKTWLYTSAKNLQRVLLSQRKNATISIVDDAKRYILQNYTNPELSLEEICSYLHISTTYFSAVFKRETGQSYIAYLTEIRMNRAVELLNTTEDKTYIIAEKVGYAEPNYFGYVFKKQFGVSPAKYRTS